MSTELRQRAFIVLLRDEVEARGVSALLESLVKPATAGRALFLVPEVRGLDFFTDQQSQAALDTWWGRHVSAGVLPAYLLRHESGLAKWLPGIDGDVFIAADAANSASYRAWHAVIADHEEAALALTEAVVAHFGGAGPEAARDALFDAVDLGMLANIRADRPPVTGERPALPSLLDIGSDPDYAPEAASLSPAGPLDLLVAESARADRVAPLWNTPPSPSRAQPWVPRHLTRPRLPLFASRDRRRAPADALLAARLLDRSPTLVVIGSRKGGVGKTSHAAGIAIVAGSVLDSVGRRAAILDANVANPDAWGQLDLPSDAATVRDVVAALNAGREPPAPVHASTPALACYPERREGVEYSRTDVRRLASHLRSRFAFTVVDMSNRLPDPTAGPEAVAAAFWLAEADALVLPTASSRQDFDGVLDYLAVPDLPPTVVPCIVSRARRNRRHPTTRRYMDAIAARVDRLVEIPDDADSVRLAGMMGAPVETVSARLADAYRVLTDAIACLPARVRT